MPLTTPASLEMTGLGWTWGAVALPGSSPPGANVHQRHFLGTDRIKTELSLPAHQEQDSLQIICSDRDLRNNPPEQRLLH